MRFQKLPYWVLENPLPALYDGESLTTVQMTAKVYTTMQKLIDDYNKYVDEVNSAIENQDKDVDEAIQFMKDNLVQTIKDLNEIGELDSMIVKAVYDVESSLLKTQEAYENEVNKNQREYEIRLNDKVMSLSSGSPKGTYATLNNLKEANPETATYIVQENGHIYSWIQETKTSYDLGLYQATGIAEKSVKPIHINFLDNKVQNLFDGNYISGFKINGIMNQFELLTDSEHNSLVAIPCKPNTKYTVIVEDAGAEDNGYYYFKIASTNANHIDNVENGRNLTSYLDATQEYYKAKTFTTDANATLLLVQASKTKQPFLQIVEGQIDDFTVSSYDESIIGVPNKLIDVYSKEEIDNMKFKPSQTTFLDEKVNNLFDGNYIEDYQLNNEGSQMNFNTSQGRALFAIPCKPNTTYTVIVEDCGKDPETNYYYFKGATIKAESIEDIAIGTLVNALFSYTAQYVKKVTFTTNATDNLLLIQTSKSFKPFCQIIEGEIDDFTISSYEENIVGTPNKTLNVYSKEEVNKLFNSLSNNPIYILDKISDTKLYIYYPSNNGIVRYEYVLHNNESINLNTWKMGSIWLCDFSKNPVKEVSSSGYDNEGVLKITGEDDYIGGVHGDEQFEEVYFFIDGKQVELANIETGVSVNCNDVKVIVKSKIYHADNSTGNPCLEKTKQTTFSKDGVQVNNKWTCLEDLSIYHVRAILLSINKDVIDLYYDSKVNTIPMVVPEENGGKTDSRMTDTFYSGLCSAHVWCGERGGDSSLYDGNITDFGTRLKSYFDCYKDYNASNGEVLYCQNNFKIEY